MCAVSVGGQLSAVYAMPLIPTLVELCYATNRLSVSTDKEMRLSISRLIFSYAPTSVAFRGPARKTLRCASGAEQRRWLGYDRPIAKSSALAMTVLLTVPSRAFSIQQTRGRRGD